MVKSRMVSRGSHVRVSDLTSPEQLVLWAFRLWVHGGEGAPAIHEMLRNAFRCAGAPEAYLSFNAVMSYSEVLVEANVEVRPPCCKQLSCNEMRILTAISALQWDDTDCFISVIGPWVRQNAIPDLLPVYTEFAILLKASGLTLRQWLMPDGWSAGDPGDKAEPRPIILE